MISREITRSFLGELIRWSGRACARLTLIDGRNDPAYATEAVHAAIADTLGGIRVWDPARVSLRRHLEQTINSRVSHDCMRARRRHHVAFDDVTESQDESPAAVEMSLRREDARMRPDGRLAQRDVRLRLFATLRSLICGDPEITALLDAYESGDVRRDEVMVRLGWERPRYVNARRRLDNFVNLLPSSLHDAAIEVLTRDGGAPLATRTHRVPDPFETSDDDEGHDDEGHEGNDHTDGTGRPGSAQPHADARGECGEADPA